MVSSAYRRSQRTGGARDLDRRRGRARPRQPRVHRAPVEPHRRAAARLLIGLIVGLAAVLVAGTSDDHLVETALTAVAAFGSFLIASARACQPSPAKSI